MESIFSVPKKPFRFGVRGNPPSGGSRGGIFGGGSPFGGGFGGPAGMRAAKMLASGDLQLIILLLLEERARHGYEIIKAIETHSSGIYTPSPGMVYPALTYLEEAGYALAAAEGNKKLFTITGEGRAYLTENRTVTMEVWSQLALFGRKLARAQQQFSQEEDVAQHFEGPRCGKSDEHRRMKEEFMHLRDELKAAIFSKIDATTDEKRRVLDVLRRAVNEIRGD
jgi:DNA-binding PadR family transcriptional regulator